MNYKTRPTRTFQKQFKSLLKKYKFLKGDILAFRRDLGDNPLQGTALGRNCYKVRMAVSSKNQGKSGGARVITYVHVVGETIYLLSIYDKSQKSSLDDGELDALIAEIEI